MDYKNAGVDIEAGYKSVELMKEYVKKTMRPEVLAALAVFPALFPWKNQRNGRTGAAVGNRRLRNQGEACHASWISTTPSALMRSPCV